MVAGLLLSKNCMADGEEMLATEYSAQWLCYAMLCYGDILMVTPQRFGKDSAVPRVEPQGKLSFASGKRSAIASQVAEAQQSCPGGSSEVQH